MNGQKKFISIVLIVILFNSFTLNTYAESLTDGFYLVDGNQSILNDFYFILTDNGYLIDSNVNLLTRLKSGLNGHFSKNGVFREENNNLYVAKYYKKGVGSLTTFDEGFIVDLIDLFTTSTPQTETTGIQKPSGTPFNYDLIPLEDQIGIFTPKLTTVQKDSSTWVLSNWNWNIGSSSVYTVDTSNRRIFGVYSGGNISIYVYQIEPFKKYETVFQSGDYPKMYVRYWRYNTSNGSYIDTSLQKFVCYWGSGGLFKYATANFPLFATQLQGEQWVQGIANPTMLNPNVNNNYYTTNNNKNITETTVDNSVVNKNWQLINNNYYKEVKENGSDNVEELLQNIQDSIDELVNTLTTKTPYSGILNKINDNLEKIIDKLSALIGISIVDTITDIIDTIIDFLKLEQISAQSQTTVDLMKTKFPFSLPFDLLAVVSLFLAPPVTPNYNIPFSVPFLGQTAYSFTIDLSIFQSIADLSRILLTILFTYELIIFTLKLFRGEIFHE